MAGALITETNIIIAKEPLMFVDVESAKTITDFLGELRRQEKK
jgi:ABC-type Mn2+/Zn2+ transport system ATPase subunit